MQILSTFDVTPDGPFPGEDYIDRQAMNKCARDTEFTFTPLAETWQGEGDRLVICMRSR